MLYSEDGARFLNQNLSGRPLGMQMYHQPNEHIALPGSQSNLHAMTEIGRPGSLSYLGRGLSELLELL
jgi:hypothetical protein